MSVRSYPAFFLILCLLLGPAGRLCAKPNALPPPIIPDCAGVNIHFTGAPAQDVAGLARGGFRWIRMDFTWATIEKVKGIYDFTPYDALVTALTAQHIRPLFILDYGNDLYETGSPRSPEARAAFVKFATAAVTHYHGKPILWEIWNEPNIGFWQPKPKVDEYGRLALETARAIKQADPDATALAPGSSTLPLPFLESLFKMGLLRWIDAVSVHPYRGSAPETAAAEFRGLRQLIARYEPAGRDIPLVSSEWGYSTVNISEQTQAQYLARQWLSNLAEGVRLSIWYDWHDDGTEPKDPEHHFGMVHNDYSPKPAFAAAQTLTQALGGFRFIKRIPLASEADYLLLFAQGGKAVKLAVWTTGPDHAIDLPIAGQPPSVSLLGAKMTPRAEGHKITLTLNGSPQYLTVPLPQNKDLLRAVSWTAQAQDPFYSAGQPLQIALSYTNTDAVTHHARFMIALEAPSLKHPVRVINGEDIVAPGATLHQGATYAKLARIPVRARVALVLDGVQQPYPQDASFTPQDPLSLSIAPAGVGGYLVTLSNPAKTPFQGQLERQAQNKVTATPVRLAAGQETLTLAVVGRSDALAGWTLRDATRLPVASLPPVRYVPYPVQAKLLHTYLDGDPKVASLVAAEVAGGPSKEPNVLKVDYQFAPGWTFWQTGETSPQPAPGKPEAFGLWVFGDDSGNQARMRFQDATGQMFQPEGEDITWSGWRFVLLPLTLKNGQNFSHWGGANDGTIHYPVHIASLFLLDSRTDAKKTSGTVRLGQPSIMYATAP